jgi:hypothetical protein
MRQILVPAQPAQELTGMSSSDLMEQYVAPYMSVI